MTRPFAFSALMPIGTSDGTGEVCFPSWHATGMGREQLFGPTPESRPPPTRGRSAPAAGFAVDVHAGKHPGDRHRCVQVSPDA
jgi:hypothetical protein